MNSIILNLQFHFCITEEKWKFNQKNTYTVTVKKQTENDANSLTQRNEKGVCKAWLPLPTS